MNSLISLPGKVAGFFKSIVSEIKLVEFPTRKQTFRSTHLVIAISIVAASLLLLVDGLFATIRNFIIESI